METIFHGHHQRAGSGAAPLLTETPVKGRVPLEGPRMALGCTSPPRVVLDLGGERGKAALSAGLGDSKENPMRRASAATRRQIQRSPFRCSRLPGGLHASRNFSPKPA